MQDEKNKIYSRLTADATLMNLLASNVPFYNTAGTAAKANSIYPAGKASGASNKPFITIMSIGQTRLDYHLYDEFFAIRAYDEISKSYVTIEKILEQVKVLLDRYEFNLSSARLVQVRLETTGPELVDEALKLNFQESRYRLLLL